MIFRKWIALVLILLAALSYGWRISDKPLDFDERYTLNIATGLGGTTSGIRTFGTFPTQPISGSAFTSKAYWDRFTYANTVATALSDNGQGIPYMTVLHSWIEATGLTVAGTRWPSALALLLTGGCLWYWLQKQDRARSGMALLALTLLLFNGLLLDLAQYIRFYTFGVLLVVLSWIGLHRLCTRRRIPDAVLLGTIWTVAFVNQYFAALVIGSQGLYLLLFERKTLSPRIWAGLIAGSLVLLLIWLFPLGGIEAFASVFRYHDRSMQAADTWSTPATLSVILTGLAADLATCFGAATHYTASFKTAFNVVLALPGWMLCLRLTRESLTPFQLFCARVATLVIGLQLLFVIGHISLTHKTLLLVIRYWTFCIPFCLVLLSLAVVKGWQAGGFWRMLALISLIGLGVRGSFSVYAAFSGKALSGFQKPQCIPMAAYPDYEALSHQIRQQAGTGDTVCFKRWKTAQCTNWFLRTAPRIVQQVDTTQSGEVLLKTPSGRRPIPIHLGRPIAARPCN
ncbi:MAG: hypothetical protein EOP52_01765 [Sphingobacteriales bacterium]|nr:MAG: hypothetical protein EOP52_01765 [Sphingobacteriales bacterium]